MNKEKITQLLKEKKVQLILVIALALLVGIAIGYEYRGYAFRRDIQKAFSSSFSEVSKTTEGLGAKEEENKALELEAGQSFEEDGLTITVLDIQRSDTDVKLSDETKRDSKVGFKVKVENKTAKDQYFNSSNFALKSRVDDSKLTKVNFFMGDTKNFTPELESNTLIDGAVLEGWITYFLPKEIQNDNLQIVYSNGDLKVKYRLK